MSSPSVRVLVELEDERAEELRFTDTFRIGRDPQCEVQVASSMVSRMHAEVTLEDGTWWIRDLGSTNGVFLNGALTIRAPLPEKAELKLGRDAPTLHLRIEQGAASPAHAPSSQPARSASQADKPTNLDRARRTQPPEVDHRRPTQPPAQALPDADHRRPTRLPEEPPPAADPPQRAKWHIEAVPAASGTVPPDDPSLSHVIRRYFDEDDGEPVGEHTQMIREAYKTVQQEQKRRYYGVILAALVLLVGALGFALYQRVQNQRMTVQASRLFDEIKLQNLQIAKFRDALEATENKELEELLADAEAQRERMALAYDGFIEEFGLYRRLNRDEELIYRMARVFNESQFTMPAGFVREVQNTIKDYWQNPGGSGGKGRYDRAIQRARENGYLPLIVDQMRAYGLPPEFFYLALQESDFIPDRIGPDTRWGRAKGMWQFIPTTAVRYGLDVGERSDTAYPDPQDERLNVERASEAAARYLHYIYSTEAQASGLLVMASYNWGEHRVIKKLEGLSSSEDAIRAVFEGIAVDPDERNYWQFLTEYEDRMPEETKDYVLKIFSAAVIGQDPRRFGFDFDDPLRPYMLE